MKSKSLGDLEKDAFDDMHTEAMSEEEYKKSYIERLDVIDAGAVIRELRKTLNWNQSDLADRSGVSQAEISRIENGTGSQGPSIRVYWKLLRSCGVEPSFQRLVGRAINNQGSIEDLENQTDTTVKFGTLEAHSPNKRRKKFRKLSGGRKNFRGIVHSTEIAASSQQGVDVRSVGIRKKREEFVAKVKRGELDHIITGKAERGNT